MLVTRTYLELRSPGDLRPADATPVGVVLEQVERCSIAHYRTLYDLVGREYHWRDRHAWSDATLEAYLARPAIRLWTLRQGPAPAGFFELEEHHDRSVEVVYFGLAPGFLGRGLGKWLLTRAAQEAWRLGPARVWLHTCTLDNPAALPNYLARGFVPYATEQYRVDD